MPELNHSRTEETLIGKYRDSIMKKHLLLFAVLSTVFTVIACNALIETELEQTQEEEATPPAPEVKLVPKTFTASYSYDGVDDEDTKTVLNGFKIEWKAGDKVAIFDDVDSSVAHEFTAESDGETTTFTGSVAAGATKYFAVYPYSAAEDCSSTPFTESEKDYEGFLNVKIPDVQHPIAGTFDPAAAVLVAYTGDSVNALNFKVPFALVKFTVDYDDVYTVSFSSGKRMTGSLKTKMRANGSIGTNDGDNDKYTTLTIKNADNSPLTRGETYYAVMRYRTGDNSYTSFTATLGNTACGYAERVASKDIPLAIATVNNLGNFSGLSFTTNRYRGYMDGLNVKVGSKTFNLTSNGDATLISSTNPKSPKNISNTIKDQDAVFFLEAAGGTFNLNGQVTVSTGNLALINNSDNEAIITTDDKRFDMTAGNLYLKGLSLDVSGRSTGNGYFGNAGATASPDFLVVDGCTIYGINSFELCRFSVKGQVVKNIIIENSIIKVSKEGNTILFNLSDNTATQMVTSFVFRNNLVYHTTTGSSYRVNVLNMPEYSSGDYSLAADFSNNLFINVPSQSAYTAVLTDVASLHFDNNIFYEGNNYGSNCYLFDIKNEESSVNSEKVSVSDNVVIGLSSSKKWLYAGAGAESISVIKSAYGGTNEIAKTDASVIFDTVPSVTDGVVTYALKPAYADRGPQ